MRNADMPANPIVLEPGEVWSEDQDHAHGLTKRERLCLEMGVPATGDDELDGIIRAGNGQRYAAMAMQGLVAARPNADYDEIADHAVRHADALLAELERTNV